MTGSGGRRLARRGFVIHHGIVIAVLFDGNVAITNFYISDISGILLTFCAQS